MRRPRPYARAIRNVIGSDRVGFATLFTAYDAVADTRCRAFRTWWGRRVNDNPVVRAFTGP